MPDRTVDEMLEDRFAGKKHVAAATKHFSRMLEDYQKSEWDDANAKAGKFVEAVLKALVTEAGETPASGKGFKVGTILDTIGNKTTLSESLRVTIPRACRFIYEIASNRGARHDADEIEASEMDAEAVMALCSWTLAEMVRYSQKGMDLDEAKQAVEGLMRRKFPHMEVIDGRVYWDIANSAREAALLILYAVYPKRMSDGSLAQQIVRHGYSQNNANVAVQRIRAKVDDDGRGNLRLRNPGVREAEELIQRAERSR